MLNSRKKSSSTFLHYQRRTGVAALVALHELFPQQEQQKHLALHGQHPRRRDQPPAVGFIIFLGKHYYWASKPEQDPAHADLLSLGHDEKNPYTNCCTRVQKRIGLGRKIQSPHAPLGSFCSSALLKGGASWGNLVRRFSQKHICAPNVLIFCNAHVKFRPFFWASQVKEFAALTKSAFPQREKLAYRFFLSTVCDWKQASPALSCCQR